MVGARPFLPTISIVLATYNGERHLPAQLDSLRRQTLPPDELLICDDGSSDATLSLARAFAEDAPFPVHIYANEVNLGFNRNFLNGAGRCTSDLIAFCDQDDVWEPEKLDECARMFVDSDVVLAVHAAEVVDRDLRPLGYAIQDYGRTHIVGPLGNDPFLGPRGFSVVCRSRLLKLVPSEKRPRNLEAQTQDFDEWVGFLANVFGKTAYLRSRLVRYRQHEKTVTAVAPSPKLLPSFRISANKGARSFDFRVELALEYAGFLKGLAEASTGEQRKSLERAVRFYRVVAKRWTRRISLYRSRPLPIVGIPRVSALLLRGDYSHTMGGGFGLRALAKDAIVATTGYRPGG